MTVAIPYLLVAAAGMQAIGAISSGQSAAASAKSQAQAQEANAQVQRNNADQVMQQTTASEDAQRRRFRAVQGNQTASIAESGIGFEGTGNDLTQQSDINGELDALNIRYEGQMKANGLLSDANQSDYQASADRAQASNATTAGYFGALGAAAQGASSYGQYQLKYGMPEGTNNTGYATTGAGAVNTGIGGLY